MARFRWRWRVRSLMTLVAVAGVAFGIARRRDTFLARADYYDASSKACIILRDEVDRRHGAPSSPAGSPRERERRRLDRYMRWRQYQVEMAEKYRQAARYPWLPVAPDPPAPK